MAMDEQEVADVSAIKATLIGHLQKIQSGEAENIKRAVTELRLLSKWEMQNRILIAEAGGVPIVMNLLGSSDSKVQENAVTTLLNLSIYPENRRTIMETSGALRCISEVIKSGATPESKENATALVASLLIVEAYRDIVGSNPAIVASLIGLLRTGGVQGKKDALKTIFHLALWPDNRGKLVVAGTVAALVAIVKSPRARLLEDALSVLAQLARCREGTNAIKAPGTLQAIVECLKNGNQLVRENSTSVLLALCQTGGPEVIEQVRRHRAAIVAVMCSLLASGSPRAKSKASELMKFALTSQTFDESD